MTFEKYLNLFESELKNTNSSFLEDEQMMSKNLDSYDLQISGCNFCINQSQERLQQKYNALKLLIYRYNIDLKMEVPDFILRDYVIKQ